MVKEVDNSYISITAILSLKGAYVYVIYGHQKLLFKGVPHDHVSPTDGMGSIKILVDGSDLDADCACRNYCLDSGVGWRYPRCDGYVGVYHGIESEP